MIPKDGPVEDGPGKWAGKWAPFTQERTERIVTWIMRTIFGEI